MLSSHSALTILRPRTPVQDRHTKLKVIDVSFWYDQKQALSHINLDIFANEIISFLGPSGCGKTTLIKCLNRTNDIIPGSRMTGTVELDGVDINRNDIDPPLLRQRFGWVAQRPDPFPWSIRDNVLYGPSLRGTYNTRAEADEIVEETLREVGLWEEVKHSLTTPAVDLSVGQQQRICIARAIASKPEIILMDEPCSALDPVATGVIEELLLRLRQRYTIVIITHNIQQAARISDRIAFFYLGELVEVGEAEQIILRPQIRTCREFIGGSFG